MTIDNSEHFATEAAKHQGRAAASAWLASEALLEMNDWGPSGRATQVWIAKRKLADVLHYADMAGRYEMIADRYRDLGK